jgi:putative ATP-dependent endonuclease of OLD family
MRIQRISAKNYRTLEAASFEFSSGYCTISGRNNAGKSNLLRLIQMLLTRRNRNYYNAVDGAVAIDYRADRTQWASPDATILVEYELCLSRNDDPALIAFVEAFMRSADSRDLPLGMQSELDIALVVTFQVSEKDTPRTRVQVAGVELTLQASREVVAKLRGSNLAFAYNSTTRSEELIYGGPRRFLYEFALAPQEVSAMEEAEKKVRAVVKRLAQQHTNDLNRMIGGLSDRYDVEFAPPDSYSSTHLPLAINLRDKEVTVPLADWGSGTQNRTQILMAILKANRVRGSAIDSRITPLVIIEEPESFLHPSAQAEFGRLLAAMAKETGIQIIVTSHSPYMLNQEDPSANILLERELHRGRLSGTVRVDTSGPEWMTPFSEHLGLPSSEFAPLRRLFSSACDKVLLVEGELDREYFQIFQNRDLGITRLAADIDVVAYGGKDTLKNTKLLDFLLSKFDRVYITYDLDAKSETECALRRLKRSREISHAALGQQSAGKDCIEGLLPLSVLSTVNGRETDLVMALGSATEKKSAKEKLKKAYLAEFESQTAFAAQDLARFDAVIKSINKALSPPPTSRSRGSAS